MELRNAWSVCSMEREKNEENTRVSKLDTPEFEPSSRSLPTTIKTSMYRPYAMHQAVNTFDDIWIE